MFLQDEYVIQESYVKSVTENFKAGIEQLDFEQSDAAAKKINSWVEQMTANKIQNIISPGMNSFIFIIRNSF